MLIDVTEAQRLLLIVFVMEKWVSLRHHYPDMRAEAAECQELLKTLYAPRHRDG